MKISSTYPSWSHPGNLPYSSKPAFRYSACAGLFPSKTLNQTLPRCNLMARAFRGLHQHRPNAKPLVIGPDIDSGPHRMLHDLCGRSMEVDNPYGLLNKFIFTNDRENLLRVNPPLKVTG